MYIYSSITFSNDEYESFEKWKMSHGTLDNYDKSDDNDGGKYHDNYGNEDDFVVLPIFATIIGDSIF